MTREEFNNTVGAGAGNVMIYNLLRTVIINKVNANKGGLRTMTYRLKYFSKKKPWGLSRQGFLKQISSIETPGPGGIKCLFPKTCGQLHGDAPRKLD